MFSVDRRLGNSGNEPGRSYEHDQDDDGTSGHDSVHYDAMSYFLRLWHVRRVAILVLVVGSVSAACSSTDAPATSAPVTADLAAAGYVDVIDPDGGMNAWDARGNSLLDDPAAAGDT
ncbi:MAG: hypothetical protein ABJH68_12355 [Ilumatobacter sp.]|uniref:hypothetical protein n=1 Tax=Ilumatobacter sp. TaxID=1967498 RepID=UPI00329A3852